MRTLLIVLATAILTGCGFHLRTASEDQLPARLSTLRVVMAGGPSSLRYPRMVLIMRDALANHGAIVLTRKAPLPTLVLMGERLVPIVASVNRNGGAQTYLLDYAISFVLKDAHGHVLLGPGTVRVQREYDVNPMNILAMARQQRYLENRMRRAAARQIVQRLIAFRKETPPEGATPKKQPPPFLTRHAY